MTLRNRITQKCAFFSFVSIMFSLVRTGCVFKCFPGWGHYNPPCLTSRVEGQGLKVKFPSVKTRVKCNGCWQRGLIKMTAHIHIHSFVCSAWQSLPRRLNKEEEGSQGLWRMPGGVGWQHTQWPSDLCPVVSQVRSYGSDSWASMHCMGSFSSHQPTPPLSLTHTHTHMHTGRSILFTIYSSQWLANLGGLYCVITGITVSCL